ncbi:MAG: (Fe-S)-binding protein [Candidatus Helarchaeota archaeon]
MPKGKLFSRKIKLRIEVCSTCMKMCRDVCPTAIATSSESFTPYIRTLMVNLNLKNIRSYDENSLDIIFSCLTCNLCNEYCLPEVGVEELITISRTDIVRSGIDVSKYSRISENIKKYHNPLGENNENRFNSIKNIIPDEKNTDTLLFLGCMSSFRELEIAKSTIEILKKLKIKFILMDQEQCCGSPAIRTGFLDTAIEKMKHNVNEWRKLGIKNIITPCSACYRTISEEYRKYIEDFDFKVNHIVQIIKDNLDKLMFKQLKAKLTYHDPCHLGRAMKVYDEPRDIIKKIPDISFIEFDQNREKSFCCGAGGGVRVNFPDLSKKIGVIRVNNAHEIGAEYLISACPLCKYHFKNSENIGKIKVLDITELINNLIEY